MEIQKILIDLLKMDGGHIFRERLTRDTKHLIFLLKEN
jgi:hypothetical protein